MKVVRKAESRNVFLKFMDVILRYLDHFPLHVWSFEIILIINKCLSKIYYKLKTKITKK